MNEIYKQNFISQNKDIIIDFYIKKSNLFNISREYSYSCIMIFKNSLNIEIFRLKTTDIEISKFIDNLYFFLESNEEISFLFNPTNSNCLSTMISLTYVIDNGYIKNIMKIFSYNGDSMTLITSFEISNTLPEFIDALYSSFILESNIENKDNLDPKPFL